MGERYIDPTVASPEQYTLLSEEDGVRVIKMSLKAGETDLEHSHRYETVYFITGGKVRIHLPNGESMEAEIPDGHVMHHEPWTHTVENIGDTDINAIIFEIEK